MRKSVKIWLFIAASLILAGCIVFVVTMTKLKWDFSKLSTIEYETNNYEITSAFNAISFDTDTADITFAPSEDTKFWVKCYEQKNAKHSVTVKDGTLAVKIEDTRKWYERFGVIDFNSPTITVYLPQTEYSLLTVKGKTGEVNIPNNFNFANVDISMSTGNVNFCASVSDTVKITATTGNINVESISAGAIDFTVTTGNVNISGIGCENDIKINVSTGKTHITDTECKNLSSNGSTGKIFMQNVIASEKFSLKRSTGDVKFEDCDAAEIFIETSTGDVEGSLLTDKVFIVKTDTGRIDVPETITGGRCEIGTDTGNVTIRIEPEKD